MGFGELTNVYKFIKLLHSIYKMYYSKNINSLHISEW